MVTPIDPREDARSVLRGAVLGTPETIDDVVDQLGSIEAAARVSGPSGEHDGIACFTRLYRRVTLAVRARALAGGFTGKAFVLDLDVLFARRYVDALRADLAADWDHPPAPRCWRLLFDGRARPDRPEWHHAALGVNAHVDFDLTFALLAVWDRGQPRRVTDQYADYRGINEIFAKEMDGLREMFGAPYGSERDDGSLIDMLSNALSDAAVELTRERAWKIAVQLWEDPGAREEKARDMDRTATWCGETILRFRAPRWHR